MKGHVFVTFEESQDKSKFIKALEQLALCNAKMPHAKDMSQLYRTLKKPVIPSPPENPDTGPDGKPSALQQLLWTESAKAYTKRLKQLDDNLHATYAIVYGQCSKTMKSKLQSLTDYETMHERCDCPWLLNSIKSIMYTFEGQGFVFDTMDSARTSMVTTKQQPNQSLSEFYSHFKSTIEAFEH